MGNLDALLPQQTPTVAAIFAYHKKKGDAEPRRGYLGASIIGHECDRFLWLTFRGVIAEDFDGRMYRLFETGDLAEERFMLELRAIGCEVFDRDPETGEQFEVTFLGGHGSGHADGVVVGLPEAPKTPHLVETKTKKDKLFKELKDGVKKAEPEHYAQMQTYMGLMGLTRAIYLVVNKDNDDLYSERVNFDRPFFDNLMRRAKAIIETSQAPEKCAKRPDDYRCKYCPGFQLCWGGGDVAVPIKGGQTCRSCCHSTALTTGPGSKWSCDRFNTILDSADVGAECPAHLLLPGLVPFAKPVDSDDDWIDFVNDGDGTKWRHGNGAGEWTTKLLMAGKGPLVPQSDGDLLARNFGDAKRAEGPQSGAAASAASPSSDPTASAGSASPSNRLDPLPTSSGCRACDAIDEGADPWTPHSEHSDGDVWPEGRE